MRILYYIIFTYIKEQSVAKKNMDIKDYMVIQTSIEHQPFTYFYDVRLS